MPDFDVSDEENDGTEKDVEEEDDDDDDDDDGMNDGEEGSRLSSTATEEFSDANVHDLTGSGHSTDVGDDGNDSHDDNDKNNTSVISDSQQRKSKRMKMQNESTSMLASSAADISTNSALELDGGRRPAKSSKSSKKDRKSQGSATDKQQQEEQREQQQRQQQQQRQGKSEQRRSPSKTQTRLQNRPKKPLPKTLAERMHVWGKLVTEQMKNLNWSCPQLRDMPVCFDALMYNNPDLDPEALLFCVQVYCKLTSIPLSLPASPSSSSTSPTASASSSLPPPQTAPSSNSAEAEAEQRSQNLELQLLSQVVQKLSLDVPKSRLLHLAQLMKLGNLGRKMSFKQFLVQLTATCGWYDNDDNDDDNDDDDDDDNQSISVNDSDGGDENGVGVRSSRGRSVEDTKQHIEAVLHPGDCDTSSGNGSTNSNSRIIGGSGSTLTPEDISAALSNFSAIHQDHFTKNYLSEEDVIKQLICTLPALLMSQYKYEVPFVTKGKQLTYSAFFREVLELSFELGLHRMPSCQSRLQTPSKACYKRRSDFTSLQQYITYVQDTLTAGCRVRLLMDVDNLVKGDIGIFVKMQPNLLCQWSSGHMVNVDAHAVEIISEEQAMSFGSSGAVSFPTEYYPYRFPTSSVGGVGGGAGGAGGGNSGSGRAAAASTISSAAFARSSSSAAPASASQQARRKPIKTFKAKGLALAEVLAIIRFADTAKLHAKLQEGLDPNSSDLCGQTLLNWAAAYGNAEMIAMLLDAGRQI